MIPCFHASGSQYAPSPQITRPGAISSNVANVIAIKAGPRVQEFTIPVHSLIRLVTAAKAPRTVKASRASRVSVTQAESYPSHSIFLTSSICFDMEGRSRKQKPIRSIHHPPGGSSAICAARSWQARRSNPHHNSCDGQLVHRPTCSCSHATVRRNNWPGKPCTVEFRFLPFHTAPPQRLPPRSIGEYVAGD